MQSWVNTCCISIISSTVQVRSIKGKIIWPHSDCVLLEGSSSFDQKSTCEGVFFFFSATQGLDSLLTERLKQNCMFSPPPTPSIFPPKQMRPRQESAEEIHTAWIRNTSTPARHRQPCCFRNCILHLCEKKEPVVIKYQNWEKKKKHDDMVAEWFKNQFYDNIKKNLNNIQ